ncbi:hypothetical protein FGO68_gene1704 [Halteria grandinella]|uniref:Uncharacterized protein n=1 Tax=Halteria grandinella TaxID=5974 RepID=A0A8J8NGQ4_HALGN|nr:hypothetical protein FGO68_gene1704 [Halteria grandinella]
MYKASLFFISLSASAFSTYLSLFKSSLFPTTIISKSLFPLSLASLIQSSTASNESLLNNKLGIYFVKSNTTTAPIVFLKYVLVIERYLSCPAVSQIYSLIFLPLYSTNFDQNSTPTVDCYFFFTII